MWKWRPALEALYLARLESEDAGVHDAAAWMLGRLKCYRGSGQHCEL